MKWPWPFRRHLALEIVAAMAAVAVVVQLVPEAAVLVAVVVVVVAAAAAVAAVVVGVVPLMLVVEMSGYLDYNWWGRCLGLFCCLLVACDAVEVVVADSYHVRSTADVDADEPVVVHDDFDSVANGDAALLEADDGTEVADGSLGRRPVGSWMGAVRNSYRGCYAAVYLDDTGDDLVAGHGAAEAS